MFIESHSPEDTYNLAFSIAKKSKPGDIYCLSGDLGVGKTIFVKGFAAGLNIDCEVTSPTFTLINEYNGVNTLYHFDVYRIISNSDYELFLEYFYGNGICLIEWAEQIISIIPPHAVWIKIKNDLLRDDNYRSIEVQPCYLP